MKSLLLVRSLHAKRSSKLAEALSVSGSQNESHFGRAIRAILRAVNRSFGSSLSLSPYPWRARGIASKVISYTCRSIGSG